MRPAISASSRFFSLLSGSEVRVRAAGAAGSVIGHATMSHITALCHSRDSDRTRGLASLRTSGDSAMEKMAFRREPEFPKRAKGRVPTPAMSASRDSASGAAGRHQRLAGNVEGTLLPDLLPNSVAWKGTEWHEKRLRTPKTKAIRDVSEHDDTYRDGCDQITKPLHCRCANPADRSTPYTTPPATEPLLGVRTYYVDAEPLRIPSRPTKNLPNSQCILETRDLR
jgi:hypothetical protein